MSYNEFITKDQYLHALYESSRDECSLRLVESLIEYHFTMINHMKETSLYDVLMYEERFARHSLEPMQIALYDNEKLKKEVNKLRKQLGKCEKYKE